MKKTLKNPQLIIETALTKLKKATWNDLQKETKLSKGALSKHLNLLIKYDQVEVDVDTSTVPKTIRYSLSPISKLEVYKLANMKRSADDVGTEWNKRKNLLVISSMQSGYKISQLKDRTKAKELFKDYLNFNLDMLSAETLVCIFMALAFSQGYMMRIKKRDLEKQYDVMIEELKKHFIKGFISPWIESIASTALFNQDIEEDVCKTLAIERGKKVDLSFFDKIAQ